MNKTLRNLFLVCGLVAAGAASADVTVYENDNFHGHSKTFSGPTFNLDRRDFNDRASSVVVRGEPWQFCEDARFEGRCVTLQPGRYPSLGRMGLNDKLSSLRPVDEHVGRAGHYDERNAYDRGERHDRNDRY